MPAVPSQLLNVHDLLSRYVAVHDSVFAFSWRKLLPIPGVFKPIPYASLSDELASIASALRESANSLRKDPTLPTIFADYAETLRATVETLRGMCQNLDRESQGAIGTYKYGAYRSDLRKYQALVGEYRRLGAKLNQRIVMADGA